MSEIDFSTPSRQSVKGVFILLFLSIGKLIRQSYLVLAIFVFKFIDNPQKFVDVLPYVGLGLLGLIAFIIIRKWLEYKNFLYHIAENQFVLNEGIFNKTHTAIPFEKIQNINIKQNLLHQFLNVVQLDIDSAGDTNTEISIAALDRNKATALKKAILNSKATAATLEIDDTIVKISPFTLLLVGITQNHFKSFMLLSAACVGLFADIEEFMKVIGQEELYNNLEDGFIGDGPDGWLTVFVIITFVLLVSIVYSIVTIFLKNYNLLVSATKENILVKKGLLNKVSYALNPDRVQSVHYETNYFKDKLGLFNVKMLQAMSNQKSKKNIEIVGVRQKQLKQIEQLVYNFDPFAKKEKQRPNPYYLKQLLFMTIPFLVIINVFLYVVADFHLIAINIVLVPLVVVLSFLFYRKSYFVLEDTHIVSGGGSISTLTYIVENHKIQAVRMSQNIFQKRKKVADLNIFVASTQVKFPCVDYENAVKIYNYLLYKVETSTKNWI